MFVGSAGHHSGRVQRIDSDANAAYSAAHHHEGGLPNYCSQGENYQRAGLRTVQADRWRRNSSTRQRVPPGRADGGLRKALHDSLQAGGRENRLAYCYANDSD
uniref:(northern house mosquito) hypothetical protein n=1 Tax=Culex pipiens TaxID=7175 RepID=A0A8D8DYB1_CULPI